MDAHNVQAPAIQELLAEVFHWALDLHKCRCMWGGTRLRKVSIHAKRTVLVKLKIPLNSSGLLGRDKLHPR